MLMNVQPCPAGPTFVDWNSGEITGNGIEESVKTLGDLAGMFDDEVARQKLDPNTEVYRIRFWKPVAEGTNGGLFWGATVIQPGRVGDEFFMTHGHFHAIRERGEYYATVKGSGALLLMQEDGETWGEPMSPGSVHYIPGGIAHRVANTGKEPLTFLASWPSDAGHDYAKIRSTGFGKRMVLRNGIACLI